MPKPSSRLGKGLNALIKPRENPATIAETHHTTIQADQIRQLPLDSISPNPRQPRAQFNNEALKELADSIRNTGVLQPIIVRSTDREQLEIVAGERRWRAAKLAGLKTIPALIRDLTDAQSFEIALIENLQRQDLDPLERAAAYQHYLESFGGTIEDLAQRLAESRANISNYLRLLKLHPEICYMLGAGELAMGQARALAAIPDHERQLAIARIAFRRNLSVRQVEELARKTTAPTEEPEPAAPDPRRQHLSDVAQALSKATGLRVRLYPGRRKNAGRIVITYGNLDEFDRVAERLSGKAQLE